LGVAEPMTLQIRIKKRLTTLPTLSASVIQSMYLSPWKEVTVYMLADRDPAFARNKCGCCEWSNPTAAWLGNWCLTWLLMWASEAKLRI
jgi:hypothetical protein